MQLKFVSPLLFCGFFILKSKSTTEGVNCVTDEK